MMKRIFALLLTLCLLCCSGALADTVRARLADRIATRTGPDIEYTEPGTFLSRGQYVTVYTRTWDDMNGIWWVQVEFTSGGETYRAYTGAQRLDKADLTRVPVEQPLRTCTVLYDADVFAGPGWDYHVWDVPVYGGSPATLYEVEKGYGLIECWNEIANRPWRVWVNLSDLDCRYAYTNQDDTYPDTGWYDDSAWYAPNPTGPFPVGETCRIIAETGNARLGPGQEYDWMAYVYEGESYLILDTAKASNGRTWYLVDVRGCPYWISGGIATVNGVIY